MKKLYFFLFVFVFFSCNQKTIKKAKNPKTVKEETIEMEAIVVKKDKIF